MSNDLGPLGSRRYVAPSFEAGGVAVQDHALDRRVKRPIMVGSAVIGAMVIGLGLWASVTPISSGVSAPGEIRVENNRKILRSREGGTVREILVREGQFVKAGQPLLKFDEVQPKASVDVMQNQVDTALAQTSRFTAEATGRSSIEFPPELTSRISDPRVAGLIRDQQFLFASRLQLFQSQTAVLNQRIDQLQTNITGLQSQVDAIDDQRRLLKEELTGYQSLFERGFAPKTRILAYERSLADLAGRRGSLIADIAKTREQMGETRMQLNSLANQRQSEAADGMREMQSRLADAMPRLTAAQQQLTGATVRAPVDGYVYNQSQHTVGGVAGPGEVLMEVVPANAPLIVTVMIKPQDIDEVRVGMEAKVRLDAFNQRWVSPVPGKVTTVSADRITDEKTGQGFYRVDLSIDPKDLVQLGKRLKLQPGMPAEAMIVTGERTIMGFLTSPITDTLRNAFREE